MADLESVYTQTNSSDRTVIESEVDGGTTAVDHGPRQMQYEYEEMAEPVYMSPQPGSDYAKMEGRKTYLGRIQQFFRELNALPWVGVDRVTVDYVPGESNKRQVDLTSSWSMSPGITQLLPVYTASPAHTASSPVHSVYPSGYASQQPSMSAYPDAVVFTRDGVQVPNQYPYPVFTDGARESV